MSEKIILLGVPDSGRAAMLEHLIIQSGKKNDVVVIDPFEPAPIMYYNTRPDLPPPTLLPNMPKKTKHRKQQQSPKKHKRRKAKNGKKK